MVRVTFIIFTLLLLSGLEAAPLAHAQTISFEKTWGAVNDDYGYGVAVDGSGDNIYVTGYKSEGDAGGNDVLLLKYNSVGTLQWKRTWGGTEDDAGYGVAVDGSGDIYVTGAMGIIVETVGVKLDLALLKFDSSGALLWNKTWGGTMDDCGYGVAVDGSGNIYVTGYSNSIPPGGVHIVLLKFNSSGGLVWQKHWGGGDSYLPIYDCGQGVAVDPSGNYIYVTGHTINFGAGNEDAVLLKYDSTGSLMWQKTWGGPDEDRGMGIAVDGSGTQIYVTGLTRSFGAFVGWMDVVLLRFNSLGGLVWERTWGGAKTDAGYGVAVDSSGGIYVTGKAGSFSGEVEIFDVALLEFDSLGSVLWEKTWGTAGWDDEGYGVAVYLNDLYFAGCVQGAERALNNVTGAVTFPTGTVNSPTLNAGTPTVELSNATSLVSTPTGSETYAGGYDVFLLKFSLSQGVGVGTLQGFADLPSGNVLMVIGDLKNNPHGSKPAGVNYQIGRDMTPLGYVRGMIVNSQPSMFDTNTAINATSGRPSGDWDLIFSIGGPGINSVSYYYETTSATADKAPIRFSMNATHYVWTNRTDDEVLAVLRSSCNVPPGTNDVFVIQVLRDADGRLVAIMYGTHYTGTWGAAEYFKFTVYPTISSWTDSYYIVQWTDAASGASANLLPDSGDTYAILAQG